MRQTHHSAVLLGSGELESKGMSSSKANVASGDQAAAWLQQRLRLWLQLRREGGCRLWNKVCCVVAPCLPACLFAGDCLSIYMLIMFSRLFYQPKQRHQQQQQQHHGERVLWIMCGHTLWQAARSRARARFLADRPAGSLSSVGKKPQQRRLTICQQSFYRESRQRSRTLWLPFFYRQCRLQSNRLPIRILFFFFGAFCIPAYPFPT